MSMNINNFSLDLGNSIFVDWASVDVSINAWARPYFGEHVYGFGDREETDFGVGLRGLRPSDYEKFSALFEKYDIESAYDPEAEFETGVFHSILPAEVSRGVLRELISNETLRAIGTVLATYDGIFVMENDLQEQRDLQQRRSLEAQIGVADARKVSVGEIQAREEQTR